MQTKVSNVLNGVEVDRLLENVAPLRHDPALAQFEFRADNRWISGGRNRSAIQGFYGFGKEDSGRGKPFALGADEPPLLVGQDTAPNPVEFLLHALAACLTTSIAYHAAVRGIRVQSIESHLEGDIDLRGFLGISTDVPKGFQAIRASFRIRSDAPAETLAELSRFSPVYDTVMTPVPVTVTVEKA
jgi:uncharacterized OsmC-like protein